MANGKIRFGKQLGGQLALVIPDGVANTEVTLPESGILAKTSDINTAGVELKTIAAGTATFTATTNNINLTGIGVGVEIGDVIQISGADDTKNNSEFTVEVITDANNIIVNQAHANKGTTKNVANRTSDAGVTVKLLIKWYNASPEQGRDWVDMTSSRVKSTDYINLTNRGVVVGIEASGSAINTAITITTSGINSFSNGANGSSGKLQFSKTITKGSTYNIGQVSGTITISKWLELR